MPIVVASSPSWKLVPFLLHQKTTNGYREENGEGNMTSGTPLSLGEVLLFFFQQLKDNWRSGFKRKLLLGETLQG